MLEPTHSLLGSLMTFQPLVHRSVHPTWISAIRANNNRIYLPAHEWNTPFLVVDVYNGRLRTAVKLWHLNTNITGWALRANIMPYEPK